jgi:hypothetical protein
MHLIVEIIVIIGCMEQQVTYYIFLGNLSVRHSLFVVWSGKHCSSCFCLWDTVILCFCLWDTCGVYWTNFFEFFVYWTLCGVPQTNLWNCSVPQTKTLQTMFSRPNYKWGVSHRQMSLFAKPLDVSLRGRSAATMARSGHITVTAAANLPTRSRSPSHVSDSLLQWPLWQKVSCIFCGLQPWSTTVGLDTSTPIFNADVLQPR